jgi:hypothetical protein
LLVRGKSQEKHAGHCPAGFRADEEQTFVIGLVPRARYEVEIDDQELWEEETDAGGTLMLALPEGTDAGVRIRRHPD